MNNRLQQGLSIRLITMHLSTDSFLPQQTTMRVLQNQGMWVCLHSCPVKPCFRMQGWPDFNCPEVWAQRYIVEAVPYYCASSLLS